LREHGLDPNLAEKVAAAITSDRERWINFMMRFELGLPRIQKHSEAPAASTFQRNPPASLGIAICWSV
jgi:vacuolar iron transporter family protein